MSAARNVHADVLSLLHDIKSDLVGRQGPSASQPFLLSEQSNAKYVLTIACVRVSVPQWLGKHGSCVHTE
ncbi:hypothetical protein BaRGS_00034225, partial [Batillaria attramentaria]